MAALLFQPSAD